MTSTSVPRGRRATNDRKQLLPREQSTGQRPGMRFIHFPLASSTGMRLIQRKITESPKDTHYPLAAKRG